jgi:hypothetical protein
MAFQLRFAGLMWSQSVAKKHVNPRYISDRKLFVLAKKNIAHPTTTTV